jgi:hypothetical protein
MNLILKSSLTFQQPSGKSCLSRLLPLACAVMTVILSGCATPQPEKHAERYADLTSLRKYYVTSEKPPQNLNERQRKTLKAVEDAVAGRGHTVGSGDVVAMPADTECKVVVEDHWFWDMGWYLLKLDIKLVDARNGTSLGWGWVRRAHPSLRRQPAFMANELLDDINQSLVTGKAP